MERHKIIELMGQLKLAGMRAAYDEVITAGLRAQHSVQRIIGELLLAQLADNRARSTAYRMGVARFPVMKNLAEFDFAVSPVNQGRVARAARGRVPGHPAQRRADRRHRHRQEPCIDSDRG